MAEQKLQNYTLIELLHLTYLIRDSLEYCHAQIAVTEETFERRKNLSQQMLAESNFVNKWLSGHPNEEVKAYLPQLQNYFKSIYEEENYVTFSTRKVDDEKKADFIEETLKVYQVAEDILKAFLVEYKKTEGTVDKDVEKCIVASLDYYRVIANWLFFNEILKNDTEYKKALKANNNQPSYEVNYNLNILKREIAGFNFNRQRYTGDKVDIKTLFDASFAAFQALDGTLLRAKEQEKGEKLTTAEVEEITKAAVEGAANLNVQAIRLYEPIWKETYQGVVNFMAANPLTQQAEEAKAN